jgi:hypothetical protein
MAVNELLGVFFCGFIICGLPGSGQQIVEAPHALEFEQNRGRASDIPEP